MAVARDLSLLIGKKFNRLTIIRESPSVKTSGGNSKRVVFCLCDCGNSKDFILQCVLTGVSKSCGCYNIESISSRMKIINKKHGYFHTDEYNIWRSIKKRCLCVNNTGYKNYGGRGISICDEWLNSVECFINDMGMRPDKTYSIARIDNNKGYYKENCRWATKKEQCQNQRTNRNIEYNGDIKCVAEWARICGMSYQKLYYRLFIAKYPTWKAFGI